MVSNITFSPRANVNFSGTNKAEIQPALNFKQQPAGDLVSFSGKKDLDVVEMNTSPKNTSDMIKFYNQQEQVTKVIYKIGADNVKTITDFVADAEPKTEAQINNLLEQVSTNLEPDEKNTLKNVLTKASENISKLSDEDKLKFKEGCKKLEELTQKADPENKDKLGCMIIGLILFCEEPLSLPLLEGLSLIGVGLTALAVINWYYTKLPSPTHKDAINKFLAGLIVDGAIL